MKALHFQATRQRAAALALAYLTSLRASALAQSDMPWNDTVQGLLDNFTDVIAPAIGVIGFIVVGACLIMGDHGRLFKVAIGVVVGASLMAKAQDIWSGIFGGG